MKLQSRRNFLPFSSPQRRTRVMGRWTVATTFHWSAVNFPRVAVPQFLGAGLIHDGSSVRVMSSHTASKMFFPRTSLGPRLTGRGMFDSLFDIRSANPQISDRGTDYTQSIRRAAKSALVPSMLRPLDWHMIRRTFAFDLPRDDSPILCSTNALLILFVNSCKWGVDASGSDSDANDSDTIELSSSTEDPGGCDAVLAGTFMELEPTRLRYIPKVSIWVSRLHFVLTQSTILSTSCFRLPALRRLLSTQICHNTFCGHLSDPVNNELRRSEIPGVSRMIANHRDKTRSVGRETSVAGWMVVPPPPSAETLICHILRQCD